MSPTTLDPSPILTYDRLPSMGLGYLHAVAASRRRMAPGTSIARIEGLVRRIRPNRQQVARYRRVCHFGEGDSVPLTYPHIQAVPLHMAVITDPRLPLPTMGLVHVRNSIVQHRPLGMDEAYNLRVWVEGHREVRSGVEFDLMTSIEVAGERVWEGVTTCLSRAGKPSGKPRGRKGGPASKDTAAQTPPASTKPSVHSEWFVPEDKGRRYSGVAGDYNPIHLWSWSARPFGFKKAIIHGMYSLARALAELEAQDVGLREGKDLRVDVAFKRPVTLPSKVRFEAHVEEGAARFAVLSPDGAVVHLDGAICKAGGASVVID